MMFTSRYPTLYIAIRRNFEHECEIEELIQRTVIYREAALSTGHEYDMYGYQSLWQMENVTPKIFNLFGYLHRNQATH